MNIRNNIFSFALGFLVLLSSGIAQQNIKYDDEVEELFQKAVQLYQDRNFIVAARVFRSITQQFSTSHRITAAYIMGARAYLDAEQPDEAISILQPLFIRYPKSLYIVEACQILAEAHILSMDYGEAARALAIGFIYSKKDSIRTLIKERITHDIIGKCTNQQVEQLIGQIKNEDAEKILRFAFAVKYYELAELDSAMYQLKKIRLKTEDKEVESLYKKVLRENKLLPIKIALLLPAHTSDQYRNRTVEQVENGIHAAIDKHNAVDKPEIKLDIHHYDETDDSLKELISAINLDEEVIAIIGGIFSKDAVKLIDELKGISIPFIIPTATANGIVSDNDYAFQLNNDFHTRGSAMALHAHRNLHAQRAAVLAPLDTYGKQLADAFIETAKKLNMKIDVVSWYNSSAIDLTSQIYTIKKNLFYPDSVDVLYVPSVSSNDVVRITHQIITHNIHTHILGSGDWYDIEQLRSIPKQAEPIDFENDYLIDESSKEFKTFLKYYSKQTKEPYSKHSIFGYDAADVLCFELVRGRITRDALRSRLAQVKDFKGLHSQISLTQKRVNTAIHIMKYENGNVYKLTDLVVGD